MDLGGEDRVKSAKTQFALENYSMFEGSGRRPQCPVIDELRNLGIFGNVVHGDVERFDELQVDRKVDTVIACDHRALIQSWANVGWDLEVVRQRPSGHHHNPECVRCADLPAAFSGKIPRGR
jgi:hypothetical protein